jgi:hypothetical protein
MTYLRKIGSSVSQMLNVALLNGHPDESLSARAYRTHSIWAVTAIEKVFGKGHCKRSYDFDIAHARSLLSQGVNNGNID